MRAMLELELELMMGFMPGGCNGLSPLPPASENFSSLGFVSRIFFLSAKDNRAGRFRVTAQRQLYYKRKRANPSSICFSLIRQVQKLNL